MTLGALFRSGTQRIVNLHARTCKIGIEAKQVRSSNIGITHFYLTIFKEDIVDKAVVVHIHKLTFRLTQ